NREQCAICRFHHFAVNGKEIAAFTNWPNHIGANAAGRQRLLYHRPNLMMRVIQRWTDEIVHGSVDDNEVLYLAALHEQHARNQNTGIADQETARLKNQSAVETASGSLDHLGVGLRVRRRLVVVAVRNAQTTAKIHVQNCVAVGAENAHELGKQRKRIAERIEFGDLTADVHVDSRNLEALELCGTGIKLTCTADRNTKLVLRPPGSDLVMGSGIDVGIDSH